MELFLLKMENEDVVKFHLENNCIPKLITNNGLPIVYYLICTEQNLKSAVGLISINMFFDNGNQCIYIRDLLIYDEHQRKGYGKEVVKSITAIPVFMFKVEAGGDSQEFWIKQGFKLTGQISSENYPVLTRFGNKNLIQN